MNKTSGSWGKSRLRSSSAFTAVSVCSRLMAHRAIDISTSYLSSLFVTSSEAFFNNINASLHRPFVARLIPCSAKEEASVTGAFGRSCALDHPHINAKTPETMQTRNISDMKIVGSTSTTPRSISRDLECGTVRSVRNDSQKDETAIRCFAHSLVSVYNIHRAR